VIRELAPAKVNLVLRVGPVASNGLHEVCSLFASIDLADVVEVRESDRDVVICEGVDGPNLAQAAVEAFRRQHPLPPVEVRIDKRIPVSAGLGGGSADAAAVLRAANRLIGEPLELDQLVVMAIPLGSDVPGRMWPGHWVVEGTGGRLRAASVAPVPLVLVPAAEGLSTADVFREADRLGIPRDLDEDECAALRYGQLDWSSPEAVAEKLENDLQRAALALRPELAGVIEQLQAAGALGAQVTGSGPTVFGVFPDREAAERAVPAIPGALVTMVAAA
jgi:4-diphosphocytidyl-2-C-methyl-D-erythritol kinase